MQTKQNVFGFFGCRETMAKRPVSAIGNRRPISEYARAAAAMGGNPRYKVSG